MANELRKAWRFIKLQKEGMGIGGLVGLGTFLYYQYFMKSPQLASVITMSSQNPSLFDQVAAPFVALPTVQLATIKVGLAFMVVGAVIGFIIDMIYKPKV